MSLRRLVISPAARFDLIAIGDYIALDNPPRAASFVAEIEAAIARIASNPLLHPARDDLAAGLRVTRHKRYAIYFLPSEEEIMIVRVLHGARDQAGAFSGH